MEMTDILEAKKFGGYVTVELIRDGSDGPKVIHRETIHNTVVDMGKRQTWRQAANLNVNAWDNFRIGTCGNAVQASDVDLIGPITATQVQAVPGPTLLAGTRTFQLVVSYLSGPGSKSVANIQEVIVCNKITSSSTVSILMRAVFTPVNKTEDDKLKITYNVRIT